ARVRRSEGCSAGPGYRRAATSSKSSAPARERGERCPRIRCSRFGLAPRGPALSRLEKLAKLPIGFLRRFLGQIMAAGQRLAALDVGGIERPDFHGVVVAPDTSGR